MSSARCDALLLMMFILFLLEDYFIDIVFCWPSVGPHSSYFVIIWQGFFSSWVLCDVWMPLALSLCALISASLLSDHILLSLILELLQLP